VGAPGAGVDGMSGAGAGTSISGPGGLISGGGISGWPGCEGWGGCSGGGWVDMERLLSAKERRFHVRVA
jgi:hypothetical protein